MAKISIERRGQIQQAVFKILSENLDGIKAGEAIRKVESLLELTEYENSFYPNRPNVRRFEKIARFLTIAPVKAAWMTKKKGNWFITDDGKEAFARYTDPVAFFDESRKLYRKWKADQDTVEAEDDSPDASSTLEEAEENAWREIEEYLREMNPYDFQDLVAALLKAMGYFVSYVSPPGKDGGIDIIAHNDPLGTETPRIKVQVKRRNDKINVDGLRSFLALLGDQDVGIFVSIGGFTSDAEFEARTQEKRKIPLIALERLFDLWVENYEEIDESQRKLLPLRPVYYLDPQD